MTEDGAGTDKTIADEAGESGTDTIIYLFIYFSVTKIFRSGRLSTLMMRTGNHSIC